MAVCQHLIKHGGTTVLSVLICVLLGAHSFKMSISHVPNTVLRARDRAEPISLADLKFESVKDISYFLKGKTEQEKNEEGKTSFLRKIGWNCIGSVVLGEHQSVVYGG